MNKLKEYTESQQVLRNKTVILTMKEDRRILGNFFEKWILERKKRKVIQMKFDEVTKIRKLKFLSLWVEAYNMKSKIFLIFFSSEKLQKTSLEGIFLSCPQPFFQIQHNNFQKKKKNFRVVQEYN